MKIVQLYKYAKFGDSVRKKYLNQGYSTEVIDSYLREFSEIRKQKPKELFHEIPNVNVSTDNRNNIDKYHNFKDLENVVDYVRGQRTKIQYGKDIEKEEHPNTLFKDNGLSIIRADNANQAVQAKGSGNQTWCVARSDSGNLFNSYRYLENEPTFYFVKDEEMDVSNPSHHIVIQVTTNGQYVVTNSNNDGDNELSWEELIKIQPKLKGKQNLFKHIPIPEDVKKRYEDYKYMDDEEFIVLPKDKKLEYLEMHGINGISDIKFKYLPDDLKNLYISYGLELSKNQYAEIEENNQLKNRYEEMQLRKWVNLISEDSYYYIDCPQELKENHPEIKEAYLKGWVNLISMDPYNYISCPKEIKNHSEIKDIALKGWINKISENPYYYRDCPDEFKNHPEILKLLPEELLPEDMKTSSSKSRLWSTSFNDNWIGKIC